MQLYFVSLAALRQNLLCLSLEKCQVEVPDSGRQCRGSWGGAGGAGGEVGRNHSSRGRNGSKMPREGGLILVLAGNKGARKEAFNCSDSCA